MWEYVTRDVRTVPESATLEDVIRLMATGSFRHAPVVDDLGRLVGIISDRDVRRLLPSPGSDPREVDRYVARTLVRDVMVRAPVTINKGASMLDAIRLSLEHRIGALPVIDSGQLVGIISQIDMLRAYAEQLEGASGVEIEETAPAYDSLPFSDDHNQPLVFLVEPNAALRRDLGLILRASRVDVTSFPGLDSLADHQEKETPDLILVSAEVDTRVDPLELLRERYPVTPVVITREGLARRDEPRKGKGPLFLPCTPETLLSRVRGEIGFNRWTHDLPALTPALTQRTGTIDIDISVPRQVLVIDQDPLARQILSFYFRKSGCEVKEAADGHEALSRLALEVFDLVTLEIDIPYRSGFELLEFVQREQDSAPRMIVVAGARGDDDVVQAFSLGALDYIKKPLQPEVLEKRLRRIMAD